MTGQLNLERRFLENFSSANSSFRKLQLLNISNFWKLQCVTAFSQQTNHQSRMCGKGVGLGLFPSEVEKWPFLTIFGLILAMFLTSQPYDFDAIAHIGL